VSSAALHVVETGFTVDSIASALRISTRVQVGCNKTSDRLLRAPKLAIGAVNFHSVTAEASAVTATARRYCREQDGVGGNRKESDSPQYAGA